MSFSPGDRVLVSSEVIFGRLLEDMPEEERTGTVIEQHGQHVYRVVPDKFWRNHDGSQFIPWVHRSLLESAA